MRQFLIIFAILLAAFPFPKAFLGLLFFELKLFVASIIFWVDVSTSLFHPSFTVSGISVVERRVIHGIPSMYASFCTPPESVIIFREFFSSFTKSR